MSGKSTVYFLFGMCVFFQVKLTAQNCPVIEFTYDATGNRIQRKQIQIVCNTALRTTNNNENNADISKELKDTLNAIAYPNPTHDIINLVITDSKIKEEEPKDILLTDVYGKMLYQKKIQGMSTNINVSDFMPGNYFIMILYQNKKKVFQIIKTE